MIILTHDEIIEILDCLEAVECTWGNDFSDLKEKLKMMLEKD